MKTVRMIKKTAQSSKKSSYIARNSQILDGAPVITGTRIPIARILFLLKDGYTIDLIANEYPHVGKKKIEKAIGEVINDYQNVSSTI